MSHALRILLVEDSPDDAELVAAALRRAGLGCTLARVEDEPGYLAGLAQHPDVVVCDFHLPRFSGARALELVKARSPATPLVIVSRHIPPQEAQRLLAGGARAYVCKTQLETLAPAIREALGGPA